MNSADPRCFAAGRYLSHALYFHLPNVCHTSENQNQHFFICRLLKRHLVLFLRSYCSNVIEHKRAKKLQVWFLSSNSVFQKHLTTVLWSWCFAAEGLEVILVFWGDPAVHSRWRNFCLPSFIFLSAQFNRLHFVFIFTASFLLRLFEVYFVVRLVFLLIFSHQLAENVADCDSVSVCFVDPAAVSNSSSWRRLNASELW